MMRQPFDVITRTLGIPLEREDSRLAREMCGGSGTPRTPSAAVMAAARPTF
jgi:hypothetical protein